MTLGGGVEKPQGAENSALKNTAPFSLTPLRISENASTGSFRLSAKFAGLRAKKFASVGRSEQNIETLGHGCIRRRIAQLPLLKRFPQLIAGAAAKRKNKSGRTR